MLRTERQKDALTRRRNTGLEDAENKTIGFTCQGTVGEFIDLYLRSDLFATRLQQYFQTDKGHVKTGLNTATLTDAIRHFGMHFSAESVLMLFAGAGGKRGKKSAKQLRNGYLHNLSEADRREIIRKAPVLIKEMQKLMRLRING